MFSNMLKPFLQSKISNFSSKFIFPATIAESPEKDLKLDFNITFATQIQIWQILYAFLGFWGQEILFWNPKRKKIISFSVAQTKAYTKITQKFHNIKIKALFIPITYRRQGFRKIPLLTLFSILFLILSDTPDGFANVISELIFSAVFGLPYCSAYATKLLITGRASIPMEQLYVRSAHR